MGAYPAELTLTMRAGADWRSVGKSSRVNRNGERRVDRKAQFKAIIALLACATSREGGADAGIID
jgi:hypothetical protein